MVDRAFVIPPVSKIGPVTPEQRTQLINSSIVYGQYETAVDRESAFELLKAKAEGRMAEQAQIQAVEDAAKQEIAAAKAERAAARAPDTMFESITKSVARSASSSIGRQIGTKIVRGVLGSIFGGKGKSSWF